MARYLSAAWLASELVDPLAEAAAAAGATVAFSRAVSGAPDGEARYTARVAGGSVHYGLGLADDVDVALTDTYANARSMVRGELAPNVAFMRGQTKAAGSTGHLFELLAAADGPVYAEACSTVAAALEG
jgi:hypothetical protein